MKPANFPQANARIGCTPSARDYGAEIDAPVEPIRAYVGGGQVVELWHPTWRERLSILLFGRVWVSLLTGSGGPQPIAVWAQRTVELEETM